MTGLEPNEDTPPRPDPVESLPAPPPAPPRRPRRRPSWRLLGVLVCFAASILTLLGSFMTLFRASLAFGQSNQVTVTITAWDIHAESDGRSLPGGSIAANGAPLVFAATLLLAAALLGLYATAVPDRVGISRATIVLTAAGAAFLAGTTWTIGMQALSWKDLFGTPSGIGFDDGADTNVAAGFWLLVVATVAALVSPLLAWLPARARPQPDRIEPETPPLGIPLGAPVAVVHRLPDAPADEPT
jgi:hypothetical protein